MPIVAAEPDLQFGEMIAAAGVRLLYLSPYSPDDDPIETPSQSRRHCWRKAGRTGAAPWNTVDSGGGRFTRAECANRVG